VGFENLEDFLKKKKEKIQQKEIDWGKIKQNWLLKIDELYSQIEEWLTPLKERELLKIDYEQVMKTEEYIGLYETKKMYIEFPDQKVTLEPIGRNIIGAAGRIDMTGKNGMIKILLVNKEMEGPRIITKVLDAANNDKPEEVAKNEEKEHELVWKIASQPPRVKFYDLNEDSFSDVIYEVIQEHE
jgi:hypothetical protein